MHKKRAVWQSDPQVRAAAEAQYARSPPVARDSPDALLHELQVHQIELEMQNETLRQMQDELEASRDRYVDLYDFAPIAYLTLSEQGLILEANLTAAALLGVERGKLRQRRFSTFVAPEEWDGFHALFVNAMQHKEHQACDLAMRRDDGSVIPVHLDWLHRVRTTGEDSVVRVTLTDTSALKLARDEILQLNTTLEERVRERTADLRASNRELEAFSYSISHDLRTPLRAINGFSQILQEEYGPGMDEQGLQYLKRIREASEHMGEVIDDVIELARFGKREMVLADVDLGMLAEKIIARFREQQSQRTVTWRVAPHLAARTDPTLAEALLDNLLRNAWKFTSERADAQIEFGRAQVEGGQTFFVRDNGVGFEMEYADKLFKPFERLHDAKRFEGSGIGLAIVRRIVLRHGGRVWAESSPGEGATFWFTL